MKKNISSQIKCTLHYLILAILPWFLSGCFSFGDSKEDPAPIIYPDRKKIDNEASRIKKLEDAVVPADLVPTPPRLSKPITNWTNTIASMLANLLAVPEIQTDQTILVEEIKNSTNGALQLAYLSDFIRQEIADSGHLLLLDEAIIEQAKLKLGLAPQDNLRLMSNSIALSRKLHATYLLYTELRGQIQHPTIILKLLLAATGEIIWADEKQVEIE